MTFYLPTKLIFGTGALKYIGKVTAKTGAYPMVVTGRSAMRRLGILDRVLTLLKKPGLKKPLVFDRAEPNPRCQTADEGGRIARKENCDVIIGFGGGSAMDMAKAIAVAATHTSPVWQYADSGDAGQKRVTTKTLPLIMVPTVAASGSEANGGAVITNSATYEKAVMSSDYLFPRVSIVDPELTLTLPRKQTAEGGVDIFCHVCESYLTATAPHPLTDGIQETLMLLVVRNLGYVLKHPDALEARSRLSWASTMACSQFAELGGGSGSMTLHGLQHPVGGLTDTPHGAGLAALLPAWMEYTEPAVPERFKKFAKNVFQSEDATGSVRNWLNEIGMSVRLRDLGVTKETMPYLARTAVKTADWLRSHPRPLNVQTITGIYEASY